jgi:3-phenylpropionate/cinnamic acid dioxygenase small subunit
VRDRTLLRLEFEERYFEEAALLDQDRLEEWLDLFADEVRYFAPVRAELGRANEDLARGLRLSIFDDNKDGLKLRVARIRSGAAHADEPPSRVRHFVANVRVLRYDRATATVASNFIVFKSRHWRDETLFVGRREDRWIGGPGSWKIVERLIVLDHNILENLTVLF